VLACEDAILLSVRFHLFKSNRRERVEGIAPWLMLTFICDQGQRAKGGGKSMAQWRATNDRERLTIVTKREPGRCSELMYMFLMLLSVFLTICLFLVQTAVRFGWRVRHQSDSSTLGLWH
jgi:hypothetical protein